MLKIELDAKEYYYLCHASFLEKGYQLILASCKKNDDKYLLDISEDQADEIRDLCGDQLQRIGFDEKYKLTTEGKILESLIDKFFMGNNR